MFLHITDAKYIEDYKVRVSFNNARAGIADLSDILKGPVFEPLISKAGFSALSADNEFETIIWPNGADLAPKYIYFRSFKNDPGLQAQFQQWGYIV